MFAKQVHMRKMYAFLPLLCCFLELLMLHSNEKLQCHHPCSVQLIINFKNSVILPPITTNSEDVYPVELIYGSRTTPHQGQFPTG